MAEKQYPFIDIAVHPGVRDRFAAGEAIILFSLDMKDVLWSNGAGARLFGNGLIYDFLDHGPDRNDVSFRQLEAAARQLAARGDKRGFMIRIASGFQRIAVRSEVERIAIAPGDDVIMFATPVATSALSREKAARQMLEGFDDPDTHMAVIDGHGAILAASHDFARIGISPELALSLVEAVGRSRDGLIKRPILTGMGYLPAAIGKLSREPDLNLLFCVETVLGRMDPPETGPSLAASFEAEALGQPAGEPEQAAGTAFSEASLANAEDFEDDVFADETIAEIGQAEDAAETIADAEDLTGLAAPDGAEPEGVVAADMTSIDSLLDQPVPDAVADAGAIGATEEAVPEFTFNPAGRPVRFVWKIDAGGAFSEVSDEFAATVGPNAGNINGIAFNDLAALLHLDPDGRIGELLKRRDTWSGRTIRWPVEGTNLVVPIDLAALPTYSRNREFDGFRGFGIIRVSDTEVDPLAMGLTFGQAFVEPASGPWADRLEDIAADPATGDAIEPTIDTGLGDIGHPANEGGEPVGIDDDARQPESPDEFRGETPALRIEPVAGRRFSDKIIQLEERRARAREGLTPVEQAAFREIARQLEPFGKRPNEELLKELEGADDGDKASAALVADIDAGIADERIGEAEGWVEDNNAAEVAAQPPLAAAAPEDMSVADIVEAAREQVDAVVPSRLRSEEALNAAIIDQLPVALLVHAGDQLIHANPEFFRLTGYAGLEALAEAGGIDGLITRLEGDDSAVQGAVFMVCRDDSVIPVHARLQSIRWQDQTALMLAIAPIALPATGTEGEAELEADYRQLQIEADELRAILETATDGVVLVSGEGEIRSMNRSASALFNYDNAETRGRPFAMLFAHESQKAVMDYLAGLAGHGVASVLNDGREVIGREANGGFIPLFMTMGKLASSNGYCAVIRDITQWKRSEEELKSAKRSAETANAHKSDFLARVSHEIRTPLNAIIGFADMMASEQFGAIGNPRYLEYANDIGRSGRHVLDIVNDLLDISKIEAGEMELEFSAVGINDCISEAVSIIQPQANSQRVIIRTSLSQSVPDIVADLRSIKQIALNILANAIRFTPSGGQVVVSTAYEANGAVVLRIRDTGVGMTRTELEQAMKPFRQVTTGTGKRGEGTGLGLPLTKAMVEANRASFTISSQPDEGTLVEITFPSQRVLAD